MFKYIILMLIISFKSWSEAPQGVIYAHPLKNNPLSKTPNTQLISIDAKNEWPRISKWRQILNESPDYYQVAKSWDMASQDQFIIKIRTHSPLELSKEYPEFKIEQIQKFKQKMMAP